jgi:uncharacterized membrane protein YbhN (UPF0104 family)
VQRLRHHPSELTFVAFAAAAAASIAIAAAYGFTPFGRAWSHLHLGWLALAVLCELLALPAYAVSYHAVARFNRGAGVDRALVIRLVAAGFGPFAPGGGFLLDKRALHAIEDDEHAAAVKVLGLGALEWALLAPAAWISAVALLATGDPRPMPSLLWPWAIAVPIGFAIGLWLAAPDRCDRITGRGGRWRTPLGRGLHAIGMLRSLAGGVSTCWAAWAGMAAYWALDIACFYSATRCIGLHLNAGEVIVAYATGYALTRRSMPLGGAGVTEALMTFALHWVGQPVPAALAATLLYRLFNFALPTVPALHARPHVKPLLDAAELRRTTA